MRIRLTSLLCAGAGAIIFSILLERLSPAGVVTGIGAGLLFSSVIGPAGPVTGGLSHWLRLLRYCFLLLVDMAVATVRQIRAVLCRRPPRPTVLHLRPHVDARGRVLVANSVTLTPGTITLEETAEEYVVLCAQAPAQPALCRAITADFEKRLPTKELCP